MKLLYTQMHFVSNSSSDIYLPIINAKTLENFAKVLRVKAYLAKDSELARQCLEKAKQEFLENSSELENYYRVEFDPEPFNFENPTSEFERLSTTTKYYSDFDTIYSLADNFLVESLYKCFDVPMPEEYDFQEPVTNFVSPYALCSCYEEALKRTEGHSLIGLGCADSCWLYAYIHPGTLKEVFEKDKPKKVMELFETISKDWLQNLDLDEETIYLYICEYNLVAYSAYTYKSEPPIVLQVNTDIAKLPRQVQELVGFTRMILV